MGKRGPAPVRTSEQMLAAFGNGYRPMSDVALELGVSRERVRQLVQQHRIPWRQWKAEHLASVWDSLPRSTRLKHAPRSRWPRERMAAFKRAHGFCLRGSCRVEAAPGRHHCTEHLQELRENTDRIQSEYQADGLCHCGRPTAPGRSTCQRHLDLMLARSRSPAGALDRARLKQKQRERYQQRLADGLCPTCGGPRDSHYRMCGPCRADAR